MDEAVVQRLLVILRAEEQLYLRLRDTLQQEREVIAQMDAAALEALARSKEELCDEARLLEESRLEVAGELALALGLSARGTRLSELCDHWPDDATPLREAHNRLVVLIGVVRELLDANALLVGNSLVEVRSTLRALGNHLPEAPTYGRNGPRAPAVESGRLVRRSA